jgi:hypothetical protein
VTALFDAWPCPPQIAVHAHRTGQCWTVLIEGPVRDDVQPCPMDYQAALNLQRLKEDEGGPSTALGLLCKTNVLDGTYWTWHLPHIQPKAPVRIQKRQEAGWCLPAGCVVIDRASRWANPFDVETAITHGFATGIHDARRFVARCFDEWFSGLRWGGLLPDARRRMLHELPALRGKDVACDCPVVGTPCHGDELLRLANSAVRL